MASDLDAKYGAQTQPISNFDVSEIISNHLKELKSTIRSSRVSDVCLLGPVELEEKVLLSLKTSDIETETRWSMTRIKKMLDEHDLTPLEKLHLLNFLPRSEVRLHLLLEQSSPHNTEEYRPIFLEKLANLMLYDPDRPTSPASPSTSSLLQDDSQSTQTET